MTENEAYGAYVLYLAVEDNPYLDFTEWYDKSDITIEPDAVLKSITVDTKAADVVTWSGMTTYVENAVDSLEITLEKAIKSVKDYTIAGLKSVADIFTSAKKGIEGLIGKVKDIVTNIKGALVTAINAAAAWIKKVYDWISIQLQNIIGAARDWIVRAYEDAVEMIISMADKIKEAITVVVGFVKQAFLDLWDNIKKAWTAIKEGVVSGITAVIDWTKTVVTNIVNKVKDAIAAIGVKIKEVWEGVKIVISKIVDGIKEGFQLGIEALAEVLNAIWEHFEGFVDSMFDTDIEKVTKIIVDISMAQKKAFDLLLAAEK